jgi:hypothetical protein
VTFEGRAFTTQLELGRELMKKYKIRSAALLTSCSVCHR